MTIWNDYFGGHAIMLNQVIVQKLKQNNISADAEKTKTRATEIWKSASRENQNTILSLAGVARTTVQRAYKTGRRNQKTLQAVA